MPADETSTKTKTDGVVRIVAPRKPDNGLAARRVSSLPPSCVYGTHSPRRMPRFVPRYTVSRWFNPVVPRPRCPERGHVVVTTRRPSGTTLRNNNNNNNIITIVARTVLRPRPERAAHSKPKHNETRLRARRGTR